MISPAEIQANARAHGVPASTVERDYAQGWFLRGLGPDGLALKGGTGIRKAHIGDFRFSDDLDFTLLRDFSADEVDGRVTAAVASAEKLCGIKFDKGTGVKAVENGFVATVKFIIIPRGGNPLKLKLDLTLHGREKILLPVRNMKVIHPYPDECDASVIVYSLDEILAEKIRALFQRTRSRDIYDVWYLLRSKYPNRNNVLGILPDKLRAKQMSIDISGLKSRRKDYQKSWEGSLRHQIGTRPDFNSIFDEVVEMMIQIESGDLKNRNNDNFKEK